MHGFDKLKISAAERVRFNKDYIERILRDQLKYIDIDQLNRRNVIFTDKGREVKKAGGHLADPTKSLKKQNWIRFDKIEKTPLKKLNLKSRFGFIKPNLFHMEFQYLLYPFQSGLISTRKINPKR